jgi:hypothetical protein
LLFYIVYDIIPSGVDLYKSIWRCVMLLASIWGWFRWALSGALWKKVLGITIAGLFVLLCYWGASAIDDSTKVTLPSAPQGTVPPQSETFWGWVIAITIVITLVWLYRHKSAGGATMGQILIGPIFLAPILIFVVWAFIAFALPEQWSWVWRHQTLFWLVTLGVMSLALVGSVHNKASSIAFKVIVLILVVGVGLQLKKDLGLEKPSWLEANSKRPTTLVLKPIEMPDAPEMIILEAIADCESGDGTPGSAHQFNDDGSPVRNPSDAPAGTGAVGMFQINLSDPAIARLVKEKGWDVEGSLADNRTAAEYLLKNEGVSPWTASRACWEPRISETNLGSDSQPIYVLRLVAPVGKFGDEVSLPTGSYKVSWGGNRGAFVVKNEIGEEARYIPSQRVYENLPMISRLSLKSLGTEPVNVAVTLSK